MKKLLVLATVAVLAAGAAQAKTDLVSVAQQAQNKIDSLTQANEDAKANFEAKKKELEAKEKVCELKEDLKEKAEKLHDKLDHKKDKERNEMQEKKTV